MAATVASSSFVCNLERQQLNRFIAIFWVRGNGLLNGNESGGDIMIVVDFGYEWHFCLIYLNFCKKRYSKSENDRFWTLIWIN